jgi:putative ABC transport system permease protein
MGLPLLRFLFRKMWNNRWLTISTLAGLIIAVAFTTSIPMYADGALKRVVASSLAEKGGGLPAGSLLMRYQAIGKEKADLEQLADVDRYIREDVPEQIGFPYAAFARTYTIRSETVSPLNPALASGKRRQLSIVSMAGIAGKVEIVNGTLARPEPQDGAIEAIVLEEALYEHDMRVGDEFYYPVSTVPGLEPLRIKIVGAFTPLDLTDPFWHQGFGGLTNAFVVDEALFEDHLLRGLGVPLNTAIWYYAFDLRDIQTSQLGPLSRVLERLEIDLYQLLKGTRVDITFANMLDEFRAQSVRLQMLLLTLAAPMIAMVFYYIAMNSRQALDRQRSDIAVLRSRGASTGQIIWIFTLEGLLLGGLALVAGPFLGWFMAKSIGSANGFLTFVDRKAIPVGVTPMVIAYGAVAVLIALAASLIPAVSSARSSIVGLKQQMARADRKPLWQRFYLDILLLALVGYGWYAFDRQQFLSVQTGLTSDQLQVQPLLFFVPALSILAIGMFFLRVFPWLLRLFNRLGRRFLPVPLYLTLTQLSRSGKAYYPLMILLILTIGLGVYNSSAARTIDTNSTERTLYQYGTDVALQTVWEAYADSLPTNPNPQNPGDGQTGGGQNPGGGQGGGQNPGGGPGGPGGGTGYQPVRMVYIEPPFQIFSELPGVKAASRVLNTTGNVVVSGKSAGKGNVMGIENVSFAQVAWFRNDLYGGYHPFAYLNALGYFEQAVLVPTKFAERYNLEPGDVITIAIDQQPIEFVIVGTVPYWPTQYPDDTPFFIANIDYIYDQIPLKPYDVWLKMEEGAPLTPAVEKLLASGIEISWIKDVRNQLIVDGKHPSRGGVFGILSLGFLISVVITLVGYMLYWFFNLSSRVVQFGVLRAMGLSRKQLSGMLLLEQAFTAGLSIVLGVVIGKLTSYLFLPFLQTADNVTKQVPPFRIVFESIDTYRIYAVVAFMMAAGATMLLVHIRRLRVHQAVKLGEER